MKHILGATVLYLYFETNDESEIKFMGNLSPYSYAGFVISTTVPTTRLNVYVMFLRFYRGDGGRGERIESTFFTSIFE